MKFTRSKTLRRWATVAGLATAAALCEPALASAADFDHDGRTDRAVFRPSDGTWYVVRSSDGGVTTQRWGLSGDIPVPGDYDADKVTDFAVWRPSDRVWYVLLSGSHNQPNEYQFGLGDDIPVSGSGLPHAP